MKFLPHSLTALTVTSWGQIITSCLRWHYYQWCGCFAVEKYALWRSSVLIVPRGGGRENTSSCRDTDGCHSPPYRSANSKIQFYHVKLSAELNARLICATWCNAVWVQLLSQQCDGRVCCYYCMWFSTYLLLVCSKWWCSACHCKVFICCSVRQGNNHNTICQIDWKLDSALSAFGNSNGFYLWLPLVTQSTLCGW